jgi:transcriptional regulator with XRE-family HTH domain
MRRTQGTEPGPVPKAIYSLRKRLDFTQAEFARKLFLERNSVSRYELGSFAPRPQVLLMLMTLAQGHDEERIFAVALADAGIELAAITFLPHEVSIQPTLRNCNV